MTTKKSSPKKPAAKSHDAKTLSPPAPSSDQVQLMDLTFERDMLAARVILLEGFLAETQHTGILDFSVLEAVLHPRARVDEVLPGESTEP